MSLDTIGAANSTATKVVQQPFKRALDLLLAVPALVLLSPVILAIAVSVRMNLGKPVLFRQGRAGRCGTAITLLKFRTMTDARDAAGQLLPDGERLNKFGHFLRASSLDELPQFWNIFRGDLSVVGPRPLLLEYLPHYTREQARRHEVLPGVTGWQAINGRNTLNWEQKFALDVWYVDHWSLALDLRILVVTVWQVLRREGITHPGHATMPEFLGTRQKEEVH